MVCCNELYINICVCVFSKASTINCVTLVANSITVSHPHTHKHTHTNTHTPTTTTTTTTTPTTTTNTTTPTDQATCHKAGHKTEMLHVEYFGVACMFSQVFATCCTLHVACLLGCRATEKNRPWNPTACNTNMYVMHLKQTYVKHQSILGPVHIVAPPYELAFAA